MHKISTKKMIDNAKIVTARDVAVIEKDGTKFVAFYGYREFSGVEMGLDTEVLLEIDYIEYQGSYYYALFVGAQNKNLYLLLPISEMSQTIRQLSNADRVIVSSQIVLEKVLDPENIYIGSVVIDPEDFKMKHIKCVGKITLVGSDKVKKDLGMTVPIRLDTFEISEFDQCVYVDTNVDIGPMENVTYSAVPHHDSIMGLLQSITIDVFNGGQHIYVTLKDQIAEQLLADELSVCFRFNHNRDFIIDHDGIRTFVQRIDSSHS